MRVFPTTTSWPAQQDEGNGVLDIININEFSFDDVQLSLNLRVGGEVERKPPMEPHGQLAAAAAAAEDET